MNYVPVLMKTMHRFTPEGQKVLLDVLRKNRGIIDKRYGFVKELPSVLKEGDTFTKLEQTYKAENDVSELFYALIMYGLKISSNNKAYLRILSKYAQDVKTISDRSDTMIRELSENFEGKKGQIIEFFRRKGFMGVASMAKKTKNPEELADVVKNGNDYMYKEAFNDFVAIVEKSGIKNNRNSYSLEALQENLRINGRYGDSVLELQKIISTPTSNPDIIKLENIIKNELGMDYVHFQSVEEAETFLRAARIAKMEGIPMPKNVTNTGISIEGSVGFNSYNSNFDNMVFLRPAKENELTKQELDKAFQRIHNKKMKKYLSLCRDLEKQLKGAEENFHSTQSELHLPMHEIVHSEIMGKRFTPQLVVKLSDEQVKTAESVSGYAANAVQGGLTEEIRTEIRTKQILHKYFPKEVSDITPEQKNLMDFLA